jgi:uncharacterized membrane protein (UPF0127 family)
VRWICLVVALVGAIACSTGGKRDDGVTMPPNAEPAHAAQVHIATPRGSVTVDVEVVSKGPDIEKGLMFREHLGADAGMLFLMGYEKDWAFWMHNTLIPLDLIFIRRDMTIAGIVPNAEPKTDLLRKVGDRSLYVLEVNGGYTASKGVTANAKVWFDNVETR